jgi:hypothetical protein
MSHLEVDPPGVAIAKQKLSQGKISQEEYAQIVAIEYKKMEDELDGEGDEGALCCVACVRVCVCVVLILSHPLISPPLPPSAHTHTHTHTPSLLLSLLSSSPLTASRASGAYGFSGSSRLSGKYGFAAPQAAEVIPDGNSRLLLGHLKSLLEEDEGTANTSGSNSTASKPEKKKGM